MSRGNNTARHQDAITAGLDWVRLSKRPRWTNGHARKLSLMDLFCGCGGMTLGVWEAARQQNRQLDIRLAVDLDDESLNVYRANFSEKTGRVRKEDVRAIFDGRKGTPATASERLWCRQIDSVELIVAGPPCQGHCDLNNSTRRNDPRNILYLRVLRAVEILRPKAVIIENVPAVLHDKGHVVQRALRWLTRLGYHVSDNLVRINRFGLPQLRKRHILLASSRPGFDLSELSHVESRTPTVGQYLTGLEDEPEKYKGIYHRPSHVTELNQRRVDFLFDHDLHNLPDSERPFCHREKEHAYVSMYGRMHWDKPAQTLTSGFGSMGQGRYVHPTRRRLLTPHEAARLQGFPDFFDFTAAKTVTSLREMIANAVPPQFLAFLVSRLIDKGVL
jgi:DNA (cytosine-5)-methyltransferase 1